MSTLTDGLLGSLVGTWMGGGVVTLPSVEPLSYSETVRFEQRSERSLDYWQRAEDPAGEMLHSESGIWRLTPDGGVEISIALPGMTEVSEGREDRGIVVLTSSSIGRATTGARLVSTTRWYEIGNRLIVYGIEISTDHAPTFAHLRGELRRSDKVEP